MTAPDPQPPAAPETDVSAVVDAIGAELYQSLMEASADEWRRWEFLTDAAKEKYRAEGARIVRSALGPLLADLSAARETAAEVLREAAVSLRGSAVREFGIGGPHDARGAAIWDAAASLDDRADHLYGRES